MAYYQTEYGKSRREESVLLQRSKKRGRNVIRCGLLSALLRHQSLVADLFCVFKYFANNINGFFFNLLTVFSPKEAFAVDFIGFFSA